MNILICDDILEEAQASQALIRKYFENKAATIKITTPEDMIIQLEEELFQSDIVIMDIEFNGREMNGIQMVSLINEKYPECRIIFLSNYLEFAVDVYTTEHIYFVLKENMHVTLKLALDKALNSYQKDQENKKLIKITANNKVKSLTSDEIVYLMKEQRIVKVVLKDQELISYDSLREFVAKLPQTFARVHGGYVVNLACVRLVEHEQITMTNGDVLPIGRTYRKAFMDSYMEYYIDKM